MRSIIPGGDNHDVDVAAPQYYFTHSLPDTTQNFSPVVSLTCSRWKGQKFASPGQNCDPSSWNWGIKGTLDTCDREAFPYTFSIRLGLLDIVHQRLGTRGCRMPGDYQK
jgi:hypothetical protein